MTNTYMGDILSAARQDLPWEALRDRNVLITGATGLIGSCVTELLLASPAGCHVYAAGRDKERAARLFARHAGDGRLTFLRHDVTEPLNADMRFDYIVHAAGGASPTAFAQTPVEVMKANIYGTAALLDYGKSHQMRRMLYVSSGEVYGQCSDAVLTEDCAGRVDTMDPRSCYPSAKRAAETLCAAYAKEYGADVVVARPSHVFGPCFTEADNRVYAQFIRNVLRGEDIVMKSDGSQCRSWCYVVDCASALLHVLLKGESGEAYNIADPTSTLTIRELAEMVASIGGRKVVMRQPTGAERSVFNPMKTAVFSTDKIEKLGWNPSDGDMRRKMATTIETVKQMERQ